MISDSLPSVTGLSDTAFANSVRIMVDLKGLITWQRNTHSNHITEPICSSTQAQNSTLKILPKLCRNAKLRPSVTEQSDKAHANLSASWSTSKDPSLGVNPFSEQLPEQRDHINCTTAPNSRCKITSLARHFVISPTEHHLVKSNMYQWTRPVAPPHPHIELSSQQTNTI